MDKHKDVNKPIGRKERARILASIRKLVLKRHFNVAGISYDDWVHSFDLRKEELFSADLEGFENGIRELLSKLGSSHTLFYHERTRQVLPQHSINATLRSFSLNGTERWMFLDVFEDGPAYAAGIKPADLLLALDGCSCKPPTMPPFGIGRTHRLTVTNVRGEEARQLDVKVPHVEGSRSIPPMVGAQELGRTKSSPPPWGS